MVLIMSMLHGSRMAESSPASSAYAMQFVLMYFRAGILKEMLEMAPVTLTSGAYAWMPRMQVWKSSIALGSVASAMTQGSMCRFFSATP